MASHPGSYGGSLGTRLILTNDIIADWAYVVHPAVVGGCAYHFQHKPHNLRSLYYIISSGNGCTDDSFSQFSAFWMNLYLIAWSRTLAIFVETNHRQTEGHDHLLYPLCMCTE